jgi:hypothetical protein
MRGHVADPTSITVAFTSVNAALEMTKLLREGGQPLQKAEPHRRLVELTRAVADAMLALGKGQDDHGANDTRIAELEEAFVHRYVESMPTSVLRREINSCAAILAEQRA